MARTRPRRIVLLRQACSLTTKFLPWLYCEMSRRSREAPDEGDVSGVLALDKFLCVPQKRPMLARIPGFREPPP